jgi:prepilin-type processing-associated H-X9-DG protein
MYSDDFNGYEMSYSNLSSTWYERFWHEYLGINYINMPKPPNIWPLNNNIFVCPERTGDFGTDMASDGVGCYRHSDTYAMYTTTGINYILYGRKISRIPYSLSKVLRIGARGPVMYGYSTHSAEISYPHNNSCNVGYFDGHVDAHKRALPLLDGATTDSPEKIFWGYYY